MLLSQNPEVSRPKSKLKTSSDLQCRAVGFQPVEDHCVNKFRDKALRSNTRRKRQTSASFREKPKTVILRIDVFFSTARFHCDIHVCALTEKKKGRAYILCTIYRFQKNVNIGQRCSSLRNVQGHEPC